MSTELHITNGVCADSLLSITSLEELTNFYSTRGITFNDSSNNGSNDKTELFRRLQRDWSKCFLDEIKKSSPVLPENLPFHSLEVDGKQYKIYGIAHHALIGEKYTSLVDNIFKEAKELVLSEQNFGNHFPSAKKHLEMPDHFLYSFKDYFLENLKAMSPLGLIQIRNILKELGPIKFANLPFKYTASSTITIDKESFQIPALTAINCGYCEDSGIKRSAYMAELARYFPFESIEMVVGSGHVIEIDHFLKKGGSPPEIVEAAKCHADVFSRRGYASFLEYSNLVRLKTDFAKEASLLTAISAYLAAGTGLLVGVKSLCDYVF